MIPARNRQRHAEFLRSFVETRQRGVLRRTITASHRSGRELRIAVAFSLVDADGPLRVIMHARSATEDVPGATQRVEQRDASYVAILDQIEDGCCVVDLRGNFLFVNEAFCRIFGFTRQFILGRNFKESMGAERADKLFALYMQVYKAGEPVKQGRLDAAEAGWRLVSREAVRTFDALRRLDPDA